MRQEMRPVNFGMAFMVAQHFGEVIGMFIQCEGPWVIKIGEDLELVLFPNSVVETQKLMGATVESIYRNDGWFG